RDLCNVYNTIQTGPRRRRLDPRILNPARQSRKILRARRTRFHRTDMFLVRELPAQLGLALRLGLEVRRALRFVVLFGVRRTLRLLRTLGFLATPGLVGALQVL